MCVCVWGGGGGGEYPAFAQLDLSDLGTQTYIETYVIHKVEQWSNKVKRLSSIKSQPHAAYLAFTHGMASKWKYIA